MNNQITLACPHCGADNQVVVEDDADELTKIACSACGHTVSTIGQVHAKIAQQAAGIGASELADDHVPLGGPPFGETT
ncbi:hypothetical protein [Devosia sediminis]|uniref:Uncharacterized protein n=1 Tax=Devosia sediminis TaxID=2798801 RepID=A0A934J2U1_9HYPH|nr:hypothetical protein [Devosia sediminis]MBJ3786740.1 hypothetical protein [Devosia sediminis]